MDSAQVLEGCPRRRRHGRRDRLVVEEEQGIARGIKPRSPGLTTGLKPPAKCAVRARSRVRPAHRSRRWRRASLRGTPRRQ
jgi:hypothetical protein